MEDGRGTGSHGTGCAAEGCWGLHGGHPTTTTAPTRGLRCKSHGNKSVHALRTVPQRLACVWPLSRGRGPSSDEARLHTAGLLRAGSALLCSSPWAARGGSQPSQPPSPLCRARPAAGISTEGLGRNVRYRRISVKHDFWRWGKSCGTESARSSLLIELCAQREFNSVTDFSYMYVYKKIFEVERGRSVCA